MITQDFKGSFLRGGVSQALPSFGVSPMLIFGYPMMCAVQLGRKESSMIGITVVSFFRNIYFRYDPSTHKWYIDASESTDRDIPFRAIGNYSNEQHCPVELRLHYRISTELRGRSLIQKSNKTISHPNSSRYEQKSLRHYRSHWA